MRRRTLGTLVLLATICMVGVVLIQLSWLRHAQQVQREQVALQAEQQAQLDKQFNDRVTIALTDVTERILSITKDPSDLFDAVKQERPNYFAVTINDTIHPYLLEALLKQEFKRRNINDDFEYGIYDCFTDSIVYGNYVSLNDSATLPTPRAIPNCSSLIKTGTISASTSPGAPAAPGPQSRKIPSHGPTPPS
jgi:two-component system phosphate regulon sensor histidine kinase PhoR